ncbi:MAG: hypothetical protein K5978_00660 [Campylobacter sp.]|nr:hypothetical protein [Campylobacter sp.]
MKWLNDFKLAVINEDIDKLDALIANFHEQKFTTDEAIEAQALTKSAIEVYKKHTKYIKSEMQKLQNVRRYIKA